MKSKEMEKLFTVHSHHERCSVLFTSQLYFRGSLNNPAITKNCNYRVMFKDPCEGSNMRNISKQLNWPCKIGGYAAFLPKIFEYLSRKFPENKCPYVFIDAATITTMNHLRCRTNIFPMKDGKIRPLCFFPNERAK